MIKRLDLLLDKRESLSSIELIEDKINEIIEVVNKQQEILNHPFFSSVQKK